MATKRTLGMGLAAVLLVLVAACTQGPAPEGNLRLQALVAPTFLEGNPSCIDLYGASAIEVKFEGDDLAEDVTLLFPNSTESVTITSLSVNETTFSFESTAPIIGVFVKAGPGGNQYDYMSPNTALGYVYEDQALTSPVNPNNQALYQISHISFCSVEPIALESFLSKTAAPSITREHSWEIEKSVDPATLDLFTGDSADVEYSVTVTNTGFEDSYFVEGQISIVNDTALVMEIQAITDTITQGENEYDATDTIVCEDGSGNPVSYSEADPYLLGPGEEILCDYGPVELPQGGDYVNRADVMTRGLFEDGFTEEPFTFEGVTPAEVNASVDVTDTFESETPVVLGEDVGETTTFASYTRSFQCDADEGQHDNTARVIGDDDVVLDSADASVTVNCYDLTVTKDADTTYTRDYDWTVEKDVDQQTRDALVDGKLLLSQSETWTTEYSVTASVAGSQDVDWAVSGEITIENNHPTRDAVLTLVADSVDGVVATVDCSGATSVPAGDSIVCTYQADLSDASSRTNTATATLQNYAFDADGNGTEAGTTDFQGTADVTFGDPTTVIDECTEVEDDMQGVLGVACVDDAPATFTYEVEFSYGDNLVCGLQTIDNTATVTDLSFDEAANSDTYSLVVEVACDLGCTLTPGYWKTHNDSFWGGAPTDETWAGLTDAEHTIFFLSGQSYFAVLWTAPGGNAYYNLSFHYIAAELNQLAGATMPADVQEAFDAATELFETYTPDEIAGLRGRNGKELKDQFIDLAGILGSFNEGLVGPGHCDEQTFL